MLIDAMPWWLWAALFGAALALIGGAAAAFCAAATPPRANCSCGHPIWRHRQNGDCIVPECACFIYDRHPDG